MNHRAKFDAASFILSREISTNSHTNYNNNNKTVTDISTPCLSACVDKNSTTTTYSTKNIHQVKKTQTNYITCASNVNWL